MMHRSSKSSLTIFPCMMNSVLRMMMMTMIFTLVIMVTMISGAAICGTEFQPCRTDKDPSDTTIALEDCCIGYTCLPTQSYVPPFNEPENIWPGLCLTDRSLKLALLPIDLKKYIIHTTYQRSETFTHDHKLPPQADYLARLHMDQGDFPQLIYRMEKKFGIQIPIPDSIPDDYEFPDLE